MWIKANFYEERGLLWHCLVQLDKKQQNQVNLAKGAARNARLAGTKRIGTWVNWKRVESALLMHENWLCSKLSSPELSRRIERHDAAFNMSGRQTRIQAGCAQIRQSYGSPFDHLIHLAERLLAALPIHTAISSEPVEFVRRARSTATISFVTYEIRWNNSFSFFSNFISHF